MKLSFSQIATGIRLFADKYRPEILTGIGIAGMITTTIMAVRATPKAIKLLEQAKEEKGEDLTKWETIKTAGPCYIPAVITGGLSVACSIGANSVNARRNAALATAYSLSESALKDYQEKLTQTLGEKKAQAVKDAIAKDKIDKDPVSKKEVIVTEKGDTLCYDPLFGRYFKSDIENIKKMVNELNRQMLIENYVSLNDFYYAIGLNGVKHGEELGWSVSDGYIELQFSSQLADDGTPCLVVGFIDTPTYDYRRR